MNLGAGTRIILTDAAGSEIVLNGDVTLTGLEPSLPRPPGVREFISFAKLDDAELTVTFTMTAGQSRLLDLLSRRGRPPTARQRRRARINRRGW